ncbi:hypothetical protein EON80_21425 [bacterium]|nr:MAG: hypothetical protein EON80_21425 [bacterium]
MNRDQAIEKASAFIIAKKEEMKGAFRHLYVVGSPGMKRYEIEQAKLAHGKCLSAKINSAYDKETWVVEFAYTGLEERSLTCDPPSIRVTVESESGEVRWIDMM